jgi:hypothetical protein
MCHHYFLLYCSSFSLFLPLLLSLCSKTQGKKWKEQRQEINIIKIKMSNRSERRNVVGE